MLIAVRSSLCPSFFVNDIVTPSQQDFPYNPIGQSRYLFPPTRSDNLGNLVGYLNSLVPTAAFTTASATTLINSTTFLPGAADISVATIKTAGGTTFPVEAFVTLGVPVNSILFTAVTGGTAGNFITVQALAPSGSLPLSVSVSGTAIVIQTATGNTAVEAAAAVNAFPAASALVTAVGNTGTFVIAIAATNLAGGLATGATLTTVQATFVQQHYLGFYLVETGEVLMSLYRGSLSRYNSNSYTYLGVTGAAIQALTDAGNVLYTIA